MWGGGVSASGGLVVNSDGSLSINLGDIPTLQTGEHIVKERKAILLPEGRFIETEVSRIVRKEDHPSIETTHPYVPPTEIEPPEYLNILEAPAFRIYYESNTINTVSGEWDGGYTYRGNGEIAVSLEGNIGSKQITKTSKIKLNGDRITGDIFGHEINTTTDRLSGLNVEINTINELGGAFENINFSSTGAFEVIGTPKDPSSKNGGRSSLHLQTEPYVSA